MAGMLSKLLFRGGGRNALDLPVAGLSALAAAFAAFAIPQDILSRAIVATGLPNIIHAAQPPLGLTARVALAVGGAAIVFGLVMLTLRLFDRSGLNAVEPREESPEGPRVRRRDGHPDAPAPRPISAARDLGEPAPPRAPRAPRAEVPVWLDKTEPAPPAFGVAPEPEPAPEPIALEAPEPEPEPEPMVLAAPALEPVAEPVLELPPESVFVPAPAAGPDPVPVPAPQAEIPTTIAGLMERLEQGLARRKMIAPTPPAAAAPQVFPEAPEAPQAFAEAPEPPQVFPEAPEPPEPADDRLQSAIASLQRLAARSA